MKYIVDMTLEVEETMALNVERSNSTNLNLSVCLIMSYGYNIYKNSPGRHYCRD